MGPEADIDLQGFPQDRGAQGSRWTEAEQVAEALPLPDLGLKKRKKEPSAYFSTLFSNNIPFFFAQHAQHTLFSLASLFPSHFIYFSLCNI